MDEFWEYYHSALRNMFNYADSADRNELNYFVLFLILSWITFIVAFVVLMFASLANPSISWLFFVFVFGVFLFYLFHLLPLAALLRRRFNAVTKRGKLYFGLLVATWLTEIILSVVFLVYFVNLYMHLPATMTREQLTDMMTSYSVVLHVLHWTVLGTIFFLMIKK